MNRTWTFICRLMKCLTMVAVMALALHAGAMAEPAGAAASVIAVQNAGAHGDVLAAVAADRGGGRHDHHGKSSPCKSACCGATCTLAMPVATEGLISTAKPVRKIAFPELATLEGCSPSSPKRPPRSC